MKKNCPICGKPEDKDLTPFCSKRCADVDLGHWFKENYTIQGNDEPDEEDIIEALESGNYKGKPPQS